jgi:uncharacterized protein
MPLAQILRLVRQSAAAGFNKAVITGGEPLMHPRAERLLAGLATLREAVRPLHIVLRTNLALPLSSEQVRQIGRCADQVVVSLDGDRSSHDARRGPGSYDRTVANLKQLLAAGPEAEVRLGAVLPGAQVNDREGEALQALGQRLDLPVRIKTLLPLGRGAAAARKPDYYTSLCTLENTLLGARPAATCGLGMNLYIAPNGDAFPCYTLMRARHHLGNVINESLAAVLKRNDRYQQVTVDSNAQCRNCDLRYLCGGFCRAWAADAANPDSPPVDCRALYARAQSRLAAALETLGVPPEKWPAPAPPHGRR